MNQMETTSTLAFDLLPNERRGTLERLDGVISYAVSESRCVAAAGTVVLLHGVGSNASRWEEFTEMTALGESWRILRMDLRGHGASESDCPATLEVHGDDIAAVLEKEKIGSAVVLGHSLGAQIAMQLALRHPQRISGLILMDPLVTEALMPAAKKQAKRVPFAKLLETLARLGNKLGLRRTLPHYSLRAHDQKARAMLAKGGQALEDFIREYSSPWKDLGHIHVAAYLRDLIEVGRPTPDLTSLTVPVLVIGSSAGTFTDPVRMAAWTRGLMDGEIVVVQCTHWPLTECPEEVSRVIEDWIQSRFGSIAEKRA